jgi:hypothetical protein
MSNPRYPVASPFAWNGERDSGCTRQVSGSSVPANDFPLVSPHQQQRRLGQLDDCSPVFPVVDELLGVVVCCPFPRPIACRLSASLLLPAAPHVPAKEKKKREQETTLPLGGEP